MRVKLEKVNEKVLMRVEATRGYDPEERKMLEQRGYMEVELHHPQWRQEVAEPHRSNGKSLRPVARECGWNR